MGNREAVVEADGTRVTWTYDKTYQLTRERRSGASSYDVTYTYDNVGNRTTVVEADGATVTWTYDDTYQLTREARSPDLDWSTLTVAQWEALTLNQWDELEAATEYDQAYTYDGVGNRLTKTDNLGSATTTSTYDAADQLETSVDSSGTTTFTYDNAGNLTKTQPPTDKPTTNAWDDENRRTKIELPSGEIVTNTYNGDGLRVMREDSSVTKKFIWDDGLAYLAETDASDVLQVVYTQRPAPFGGVASLRRFSGAAWTTDYFHLDFLGSTSAITNSSETTQESYLYDAWGNLLTHSTLEPALLYVGDLGYYADWIEGSMLDYYVRARTYNPMIARWLSIDLLQFFGDIAHWYDYVANRPTFYVDPLGLISQWNDDLVLTNRPQSGGSSSSLGFVAMSMQTTQSGPTVGGPGTAIYVYGTIAFVGATVLAGHLLRVGGGVGVDIDIDTENRRDPCTDSKPGMPKCEKVFATNIRHHLFEDDGYSWMWGGEERPKPTMYCSFCNDGTGIEASFNDADPPSEDCPGRDGNEAYGRHLACKNIVGGKHCGSAFTCRCCVVEGNQAKVKHLFRCQNYEND